MAKQPSEIDKLKEQIRLLTAVADSARELVEYVSYQEIIGQCGNRTVIRKCCDNTFKVLRELDKE